MKGKDEEKALGLGEGAEKRSSGSPEAVVGNCDCGWVEEFGVSVGRARPPLSSSSANASKEMRSLAFDDGLRLGK